jgi:transcription elongation factor GreA
MKEKTLLTAEGLSKLQKEFDFLTKVKRKEVTERIGKAREYGDISENSEYDAARDEQSFTEGRILELQEILKNAEVVQHKQSNIVTMSSRVVVEVNGEEDEFEIVSSVESNPFEGKISVESPVGKALLGSKVGDTITVSSTIKATYKILRIK